MRPAACRRCRAVARRATAACGSRHRRGGCGIRPRRCRGRRSSTGAQRAPWADPPAARSRAPGRASDPARRRATPKMRRSSVFQCSMSVAMSRRHRPSCIACDATSSQRAASCARCSVALRSVMSSATPTTRPRCDPLPGSRRPRVRIQRVLPSARRMRNSESMNSVERASSCHCNSNSSRSSGWTIATSCFQSGARACTGNPQNRNSSSLQWAASRSRSRCHTPTPEPLVASASRSSASCSCCSASLRSVMSIAMPSQRRPSDSRSATAWL